MGDQVGGFSRDCFADLTRNTGTTQYTAGDHIAGSTAGFLKFPLLRNPNGSAIITGGRIVKSTDTITALSLRLFLFGAPPFATASIPADNAAITFTYASMANFLGYLDFVSFIDIGSVAVSIGLPARQFIPVSIARLGTQAADDTASLGGQSFDRRHIIYGMLTDRGGYTPADSEQFRIWLDNQLD